MEANTATVSTAIPAASRLSQERAAEGVQGRGDQGDSSAAFSQRTNVSIETAIDHLADILSKISGRQQTNVQQMPQELKEVVQNMIRQSFSLETTLAQGLGSTAASQRFSTDQLTTFARMLNQLGTMSETGTAPRISDDLAAILIGLKAAIAQESGGEFEPIMLTKAAFQLLDTGDPELLPKELRMFLSNLNMQGSGTFSALPNSAGSTSLSFLNQLVQFFMPRDGANSAPQTSPSYMQDNSAQLTGGQESRGTSAALNQTASAMESLLKENPSVARQAETTTQAMQRKPIGEASVQTGTNLLQNTSTSEEAAQMGRTQNQENTLFGGRQSSVKTSVQSNGSTQPAYPQNEGNTVSENAAKSPAQTAQASMSRFFTQTMENTPQTMNVLRQLAQTLLQNENLSQRETLLLQNFVSERGQTLNEGDAKQLQQLIQLAQQNIPGTIRQAALEQQMPDLPRLWAFMQMADIIKTRKMTADQYKRAGRDVAALALSMRSALEGENAAPQPGQRSMNFVMPLFIGTSEYPAYIHVYDEAHQEEETDRVKKETWLRICILTDYIGTVELINRIYEENHVDMRLYFSDADAAWEFRNSLDSIRESADGTSLIIEGIQIGAIGERRFFTN